MLSIGEITAVKAIKFIVVRNAEIIGDAGINMIPELDKMIGGTDSVQIYLTSNGITNSQRKRPVVAGEKD